MNQAVHPRPYDALIEDFLSDINTTLSDESVKSFFKAYLRPEHTRVELFIPWRYENALPQLCAFILCQCRAPLDFVLDGVPSVDENVKWTLVSGIIARLLLRIDWKRKKSEDVHIRRSFFRMLQSPTQMDTHCWKSLAYSWQHATTWRPSCLSRICCSAILLISFVTFFLSTPLATSVKKDVRTWSCCESFTNLHAFQVCSKLPLIRRRIFSACSNLQFPLSKQHSKNIRSNVIRLWDPNRWSMDSIKNRVRVSWILRVVSPKIFTTWRRASLKRCPSC